MTAEPTTLFSLLIPDMETAKGGRELMSGCMICGLGMDGGPSMGGNRVCGWCDCGCDRDGTEWDLSKTVLMIGKGSVFGRPCLTESCDRVRDHAGAHFDAGGAMSA